MRPKKAKRNVKDSVFRNMFSRPYFLRQLYMTLHPEDKTITEEELKIVTLESVLVNGIRNDLGFFARDKMLLLVEAQSTWSPNIVLRAMIYLFTTYQNYFNTIRVSLHTEKIVDMPWPELYVIYSGDKKVPDVISLNEIYFPGRKCRINGEMDVIHLGNSSAIINQYIEFCMVWNSQSKEHGCSLTAIRNTIRICKEKNFLREYLTSRETEVEDIMKTLYDQEWETRLYYEGKEKEWRKEGIQKGILTTVVSLMKKGKLTETEAAEEAGMTVPDFKKAIAALA